MQKVCTKCKRGILRNYIGEYVDTMGTFSEFPKMWDNPSRYYEEFVVHPHSKEFRMVEYSFLQTLNFSQTRILEVSCLSQYLYTASFHVCKIFNRLQSGRKSCIQAL